MYYKCELLVGDKAYDVTNDLVNWDEVEVSLVRNDYDGVVRSFTNKFEFAGGAYLVLTDEYRKNYLQAKAMIVYSTRNNSWLWNERFRCALDFSTFGYDTNTCEINAVDDSLASLIKAKKGTEYEYSVDVIKEGMRLKYDRLSMTNTATWLITGDTVENEGGTYIENTFGGPLGEIYYYTIPIYITTSELHVRRVSAANDVSLLKIESFEEDILENIPFFQNLSKNKIKINLKAHFILSMYSTEGLDSKRCDIFLERVDGENRTQLYTKEVEDLNIIDLNLDIDMPGGSSLIFYVRAYGAKFTIYQTMPYASEETLNITFVAKEETIDIDVVKPLTLLNRLLQSMNGGAEGITGEIADSEDGRLENTVLVAADSVRGISGAKLYTSYNKFLEWMEAEFGFVPVVDDTDKKVTFVHRDSLFRDEQVKDLGDECTDFEFRVNESLIYSRVSVGYDKQDYDSVNGRDEWRFTNDYSTGVTLTDNVLELISPYRADAYGMEFLAVKRGEETTDDESDNDVFMVGVVQEGESYVPERGGKYELEGVISPATMFNAMYSQQFMIRANRKFIGVSADKLERTSAEGNGEVTVGGVREDADVLLPDRLFTVGELSVKTGDMQVPEDLSGYVTMRAGGVDYKGYVTDVSYKYGREEAVEYEIVVSGE